MLSFIVNTERLDDIHELLKKSLFRSYFIVYYYSSAPAPCQLLLHGILACHIESVCLDFPSCWLFAQEFALKTEAKIKVRSMAEHSSEAITERLLFQPLCYLSSSVIALASDKVPTILLCSF